MSYQLKSKEKLSHGIKRIATEEIDDAIAQLMGKTDNSQDEAIHEARKSFKKLRAVVRLIRDSLGEAAYREENACFRDVGRLLSDVRDAQVYVETLDKLSSYYQDYLTPKAFEQVRSALMVQRYASDRADLSEAMETAIHKLKDARDRIKDWNIEPDDWSAISSSFQQIYKQGYKAFPQAYAQPTSENFHEWRKQVKYLWYHLRLLQPLWPDVMSEMSDQLKVLADYLGDDHDLAILRQLLAEQPQLAKEPAEIETILALCDRRQPQLKLNAKALGDRVYAEKPSAFTDRLGQYWQAWRSSL
ncbi:CHAD domain-containing protein [Desertifilum sp. FACHB-1129]|uniref:CHAD domain-containing protein n=1 Tax=Desertifilum tharense IPPAS B-1220 TaxID=1781255 RepID=A0A1E5QGP1_9CYAN|nr:MULTISPECIES: CHAD domain-containing protein [Desertifilum]MDA0209636.1 CHAD domain-containing protein [Cyanobacteria bacterium FC1]MBD2313046.1 CHAD domain-containing protein [Desertifilum sp. FACHB-1129]MBD2320908.1 CHAD domain-containing protein [Desertifilum sp. FACHB-866]MBD2331037.1 CHAD domain-containing protein [Desertifilum sp. FACHB-868]OEJ73852.1 hypothetical protein BH720_17260 [Desertifilum tharense IPPAS B-1220]